MILVAFVTGDLGFVNTKPFGKFTLTDPGPRKRGEIGVFKRTHFCSSLWWLFGVRDTDERESRMDTTVEDIASQEFKSPLRKLVLFFQRSRDQWKAKHHALKYQEKIAQNQARAVEKSRDFWRKRAEEAEQESRRLTAEVAALKKNDVILSSDRELIESFNQKPAGHFHSIGMILCFLKLVLSSIGCRPAARALKLLAALLPGGFFPSANGGQLWLLRVGLYELQRPREPAEDWVWMIDHTIQTGHGKCFVVFAFRQSLWEKKIADAIAEDPDATVALEHRDLSVWMIERVDSSTGDIVHEQLKRLSKETGIVPCCVISDQGADVRNGGEQFCDVEGHKSVMLHDISHAVANALKRQLEKCPKWTGFMADANQFKTKVRQSHCAFLMPPELKTKARWMNLEPLVAWSQRALAFLDNPKEGLHRAKVPVNSKTIKARLGWLGTHREAIGEWTTLMDAASTTRQFIRINGYHQTTPRKLKTLLSRFTDGPARALCEEVQQFVVTQSSRAGKQHFPGCTEILESLIGKGKQLMGSTKNGYTKSLLGLAASVTDLTAKTVLAALNSTTVSDVQKWVEEKLGLSLQAQKQRALPQPATE